MYSQTCIALTEVFGLPYNYEFGFTQLTLDLHLDLQSENWREMRTIKTSRLSLEYGTRSHTSLAVIQTLFGSFEDFWC